MVINRQVIMEQKTDEESVLREKRSKNCLDWKLVPFYIGNRQGADLVVTVVDAQ